MHLIPHLLGLLGLLALGTVHTIPLTEVELENEGLALDPEHPAASSEVELENERLALDTEHPAASAEVKLHNEVLDVQPAALAEVELEHQGLALDTPLHTDPLPSGEEKSSWYEHKGRRYLYVRHKMTWADAEENCRLHEGANLVSIRNEDEWDFVQYVVRRNDPSMGWAWIGLSDVHKDNFWMWTDGCKADFFKWRSGAPDSSGQKCVHMNCQREWHDYPCSTMSPSVCATRIQC